MTSKMSKRQEIIEPPHYRGFLATIGSSSRFTYLDRGSRRVFSLPSTTKRSLVASGVFIYGNHEELRIYWQSQSGARRAFKRIYIRPHFPYFALVSPKGSYKTLHLALMFDHIDNYRQVVFCNDREGSPYFAAEVLPQKESKLLRNEQQISSRLEKLNTTSSEQSLEDFPFLEQSIRSLPRKEMALEKKRLLIELYCRNRVNHRLAHKLLKEWIDDQRKNSNDKMIENFKENLAKITFPLALGRHGFNPSFKHLNLDEIEQELFDLILVLQELGTSPFLNSGTLLGYFRDGKPIPHDDDFDLGVLINGDTEDEVAQNWKAFILNLGKRMPIIDKGSFLAVKLSNSVQVDLFCAWIINRKLFVHPYCWSDVDDASLIPLGVLSIRERNFPVPSKPGEILQVNYGPNWKIPDPFWRFDYRRSKKRFGKMLKKLKTGR